MPKLYYTPTSCGAASFIASFISGVNMECEIVDLTTHETESRKDFYKINPKGNVPCIVLDNGEILNENIACLMFIADMAIKENKKTLIGEKNNIYLIYQNLSYIASELHATIGLFFNPEIKFDMNVHTIIKNIFDRKMKYLEKHIIKTDSFIVGSTFTVVDSYLHIVLSWFSYVGLNIEKYPNAKKYYDFIVSLEDVKEARKRMAASPRFIL
jgi:glutathione S-transferase